MRTPRKQIINTASCITAILVFLLTAYAHSSGEQKLITETIKGTALAIDVPAEWHKGPISGESILLCRSPGGVLYPNINISKLQRENNSLEDAYAHSLSLLNNPQVFKEETLTVNGLPAHYSALVWMSPLGGLKAVRLFVQQKDNSIFLITYVDKDTGMTADDYRLYLQSINSVRQIKQ